MMRSNPIEFIPALIDFYQQQTAPGNKETLLNGLNDLLAFIANQPKDQRAANVNNALLIQQFFQ